MLSNPSNMSSKFFPQLKTKTTGIIADAASAMMPVVALFLASFFLFLLTTSVSHAAVLRTPPNNLGLVGYWSFDEGTSTTAGDFSGKGNKGTITAGTGGWISGKHGKAYNFDGTDDDVRPRNNAFNSLADGTISMWVKPNAISSSASFITGSSLADGNDYVTIGFISSKVSGLSRIGGVNKYTFSADTTLPVVGKWQHVVWTKTGTTHAVYINGTNQTLTFSTDVDRNIFFSNVAASAGTVGYTIGQLRRNTNANYFNGSIDDLRIYSRALSAAEVAALYRSGEARVNAPTSNPALTNGLVGWWTLDGKDISDKVYDISGQGNNGYIYGVATTSAKIIGKIGQALTFKGVTGNYVRVTDPSSGALDFPADQNFTYTMWFKRASGTASVFLLSKGSTGTADTGYSFVLSGGKTLLGELSKPGEAARLTVAGSTINDNNWHHLVVAHNRTGNMVIYLDGIQNATRDISAYNVDLSNSTNFLIGAATSGAGAFPGLIDDVRIYSRALSASEVSALYRSGAAKVNASQTTRLTDGLVGYWTFDGKDLTDKVYDVSGQANNGYISGVATSSAKTIGKVGQGLKFDGVDDEVVMTSPDPSSATAYTISAWVKSKSTALNKGIAGWFDGVDGIFIQSGTASGGVANGEGIVVLAGNGADFAGVLVDIDSMWHHAVLIFDGSLSGNSNRLKLYYDGSLQTLTFNGAAAIPSSLYAQSGLFRIGEVGTLGRQWNGFIDEVRTYNRALTAAEVKQLYLMGK